MTPTDPDVTSAQILAHLDSIHTAVTEIMSLSTKSHWLDTRLGRIAAAQHHLRTILLDDGMIDG